MSGKYSFLGILTMIENIKLVDISDQLFSYFLPIFAKKPPIAIVEWKMYLSNRVDGWMDGWMVPKKI